jgi:hypothetical protein
MSIDRYSIINNTTISHLSEPLKRFMNQLSSVIVLEKLKETLNDSKWINAMNIEMNALKNNNIWEITNIPSGKKDCGGVSEYTLSNMMQKE